MDADKVKLNVLGISYSPMQTGAFAMLLAEEDGPRRIPVVIGSAEAQSIAIKLEGVVTPRPMTHDLFCSMGQAFGISLKEVYIYDFDDGIFSSELCLTDNIREIKIDSRTSDAVAIAVRCDAPIYIKRSILDKVGRVFDDQTEAQFNGEGSNGDQGGPDESKPEQMKDSELQQLLNKYIEEENYEEAAKISEIIKNRKAQ